MAVPDGYQEVDEPGGVAVVRSDVAAVPLEVWWGAGAPLPGARGRGAVAVIEYQPGARGVARTFRRGGALRVLRTRFLAPGRARRELAALDGLLRRGVPAVEPLAALSRRRGVFFHQRLVTRLVEGALPLPAFVAREPARAREAVREAGRVVRLALDAGLDHPDLHPDNLLASLEAGAVRVRLLDLDRARLRAALPQHDADRMLLRMARYLERHRSALPLAVRALDRVRFLAGMGLDRAARRAELGRLRAAYERAVLRHRVSWGRWRPR